MTTLVFLRKELTEGFRTSKVLIIGVVMIFFALMGPITAKYTNEIIKLAGDLGDFQMPEPKYIDSFAQFFKNNSSIGMLALILAYMGGMSKEKDKKTVYLMLTKGLSRRGMYLSKLFASMLTFSVIYWLSVVVFYVYTWILFGSFSNENVLVAMSLYWVYGLFILCLTLFFSNLTVNVSISATLSIISYFTLTLLTQIKAIREFVPGYLSSLPLSILNGSSQPGDCTLTVLSTIGLMIICVIGGISIYNEQEL